LKQGTGMLTYTEKSVTYYSYWQDSVRLKNEEFRLNEMVAEEIFENGLLIRTEYVSGLNQVTQSVFNSDGLIWKKQFRYD
jgi:hypothetical protein